MSGTMADDFDDRSDRSLHDEAIGRAVRHLDIGYFRHQLEVVPAARAGAGDIEEAEIDVIKPSKLLAEAVSRDPELLAALRPLHIEYLRAHGEPES